MLQKCYHHFLFLLFSMCNYAVSWLAIVVLSAECRAMCRVLFSASGELENGDESGKRHSVV